MKYLLPLLFLTATASAHVTVTDADAKSFSIRDTGRVITLGGAVTEIMYALGAGSKAIAADISSYYPTAVTTLLKMGAVSGHLTLNLSKPLGLV